ncbi:MAG: type IX secretion system protein PorQ [Bacteroidota bacterium]
MHIFDALTKRILLTFLLAATHVAFAQTGGNSVYRFLELHPNARVASLGGLAIATKASDINLTLQNPSLLSPEMNNQVAYSHLFLFSDIQAGYVAYGKHIEQVGTFSAGIHYISYGNFTRTADNGEKIGTFTAGDYSFNIGYARQLDKNFSVGGQVKFIYSSLEAYTSTGIAVDAGITYHNPERLLTIAATVNNVGTQLTTYTENTKEELPLSANVGIAKKLANAPFRFTLTGKQLNRPGKLLYQNPFRPDVQKDLETGQTIDEDLHAGKLLLSHINASTELLLGKHFYFAVGYNYLRRWEMKLRDMAGSAGFSWGFGLRISKFQLAYGSASYFTGNSTDHLSIIVNINDFRKKK